MQAIVPTGADNPNDHDEQTIRDALVGKYGSRRMTFHYRLLDSTNTFVQDLTNILSCTIDQDWLADIKRTATFDLLDTGEIDFLSDRIQPWIRLHLPPYGEDDWVQWPQGVFLLSTPTRSANPTGQVLRAVQAYDQLQVYTDDAVTARYTVLQGTEFTDAVETLLTGVPKKNSTVSPTVIIVAKEWEPGTTKLAIINDLLRAINYESLSFDEEGTAIVQPYRRPGDRAPEYYYRDDEDSVILPQVEQTLDLFNVPNKWTLVVSDPDRAAMSSTYTNTDPASLTSTVRRGRTIVDFRTEEDAPDQATLDAKVRRLAYEASQVFEAIEFQTAIMPIHSGNDVYHLRYEPLAIDAQYSEQSWSMTLKAGTTMRHRARRVAKTEIGVF